MTTFSEIHRELQTHVLMHGVAHHSLIELSDDSHEEDAYCPICAEYNDDDDPPELFEEWDLWWTQAQTDLIKFTGELPPFKWMGFKG